MSSCGNSSFKHIFESPIPENPSSCSFIDTLSSSWKQIRPIKPPDHHSFTEIFGELHFKENPTNPDDSNTSQGYNGNDTWGNYGTEDNKGSSYHKKSDSFSSLNIESLQICTEGLGSESMGDVEDLKVDFPDTRQNRRKSENVGAYNWKSSNEKTYPPPISCIGKTGKPGVCFESYREDGRFVLKETRIPTNECLRASREDGRLRLGFIQSSNQDDDGGDDDDTRVVVDDEDDTSAACTTSENAGGRMLPSYISCTFILSKSKT